MSFSSGHPRGVRIFRRHTADVPDRIRCRICGFPGNRVDVTPGENFPTALVTTGETYVWTQSNDALATLDLTVLPVTNPAVSCSFCGGTLLLTGQKGSGQ